MVNKFDEIFFDKVTKRLVNIFKGMDWCLNVNCIIVLDVFFLVFKLCFVYLFGIVYFI